MEPGGVFGHKGSVSDMFKCDGQDEGNERGVFVRILYVCNQNCVLLLEEWEARHL